MAFELPDLVACLHLTPDGEDAFLGRSPDAGWQRIFGGLVLAQALSAVERCSGGRPAHALHALFLRPGVPAIPIRYAVTRLRDGRSFSARQCIATQNGAAILTAIVSLHDEESGFEHQLVMPVVPKPEELPSLDEIAERFGPSLPAPLRAFLDRERVVELRPVDLSRLSGRKTDGRQAIWLRAAGRLPDAPALHRATLAYLSDMTLLDAALAAHGSSVFDPAIQAASLDHSLWLHRSGRADEWLLYVQDSPSASGARGFARGSLLTREGGLVASVAQEGLVRRR